MEPKTSFAYCTTLVQENDPDRFQTVMFAPAGFRDSLCALYAFNYEVAKTRETVSEAMLGEIRLQWWRDAIEEIYNGTPRQHEVVQALSQTIKNHNLPKELFDDIINGRSFDLYDDLFADEVELGKYLQQTVGSLNRLAIMIMGGEAQEAADLLGQIWGVTGLVRAIPFYVSQGKLFLPESLIKPHGISLENIYQAEQAPKLSLVIQELTTQIKKNIETLTNMKSDIPVSCRSVFLLATLSRSYLKTLAKAGNNPFLLDEKDGVFSRQLSLTWNGLRRRF